MVSRLRVNGNTKITDLAAYTRKKVIQRNKFWVITIGICIVLFSTVVYFEDEITQTVNDPNVLITPYVSQ
jgi:hypothetical protein